MSDAPDATADLLDTSAAGPASIRGGVLRVVTFFGGALLSLASTAVLLRHLGVADTGKYVTVQAVVVVAAGVTDGGLTILAVREHATLTGAAREAMMRDLLGLRLLLTTIGMIGAVLFTLAAGYDRTLVLGTAISGIAVLLTALLHQLGTGLLAQLRQGWVSSTDLLRQAVTAAVIVGLVLAGGSLVTFFWANVAGCGVALVAIVVVTRGTIPLRPAWNATRWRALLSDTLPYSVATAVGAVYFRLAIVLVSLIATESQTGYYAAAFRGVEVLLTVPTLIVGAAFPILSRAARDDRERLSYALGRIVEVSTLLGAGVALTLGAGAPFIMRVVAGDDFLPAADVLRIQGVGLFFSFVGSGWAFTALGMRAHGLVLRSNLVALACCAILVPILASSHDAIGAAVATTISEAVLAGMLAVGVHRAGVKVSAQWALLGRILAAVAIGVALALIPGLGDLLRLVVSLAGFVVAVVVLRALPEEAREQLPGPLGRLR